MDNESLNKWTKIRQIGRWNFIILYGVLGFGGGFFFITNILFLFLRIHDFKLSNSFIFMEAGICLIGGACFGIKMWNRMEESYTKDIKHVEIGKKYLVLHFIKRVIFWAIIGTLMVLWLSHHPLFIR